jgi:hypothetical protein
VTRGSSELARESDQRDQTHEVKEGLVSTRAIAGPLAAAAMAAVLARSAEVLPLDGSSRCSLRPFPGARTDELYFVGTALRDTALAGRGAVIPSAYGGHWGRGTPRDVYGQVVRIELLPEDAPRELNDRAGDQTIIVVPWDYDAECTPTYWSRSAAWVEAGLEDFYTVRLRPERLGTGGPHVADAFFADIRPYPHGPFYRAGYRGTDALQQRAALTPREYFSLYSVLPTASELRDGSGIALRGIERWAAAHPDLAARYPADQILASIRQRLQMSR